MTTCEEEASSIRDMFEPGFERDDRVQDWDGRREGTVVGMGEYGTVLVRWDGRQDVSEASPRRILKFRCVESR